MHVSTTCVHVQLQMEYTLKGYAFDCTHTLACVYKNEVYLGLRLCALLPVYVLFSDFSKILTTADQHSAQTTHFGTNIKLKTFRDWNTTTKKGTFASHCQQLTFRRKENTAAYFQTDQKEDASCGIYLLHKLPQTSTKDHGS